MVAGIDRWQTEPEIHEPRLERELRVGGFAAPPATERDQDIPVVRFPSLVSCPVCNRLDQHRFFTSFDRNICPTCEAHLIPARFVTACANGHVDDFPFFLWIHKGSPPSGVAHSLRMRAAGASASLKDIEISCACGKVGTMEGAFGKFALRGIAGCTGRRPWLAVTNESCAQVPRTLQRGASNVWFPVVRSALSIPPWSEGVFQVLNRRWGVLQHIPDDALKATLISMGLAGGGYSIDDVLGAVLDRKRRQSGTEPEISLRESEHEAIQRGRAERNAGQEFVCLTTSVPNQWSRFVSEVRAITRLREVRVLQSFTRILPPSPADAPERRASLYSSSPGWLPAIEVLGEGIFVGLAAERLREWEGSSVVRKRAARIDRNYAARFAANNAAPDRTISPRFVLIHTLAHLLINQLALDCGYPAASLRERIYVSDSMAGFLIYTATSDSAGSLGGVVSHATADRIDTVLREAMAGAGWCTADPLCIESAGQGVDGLNLGACHACVLLPEVSCEEQNTLLDRALVVEGLLERGLGYFVEVV